MNRYLHLIWFVCMASAFAFIVPPFEAPDEPWHLNYVNYVARTLSIPVQTDPQRTVYMQGVQPPTYYFAAGLLVRALQRDRQIDYYAPPNPRSARWGGDNPNEPLYNHRSGSFFATPNDRAAFYVLRLFSVLLALLTLLLASKIVALAIPDALWRQVALWFMATLPQFAFISGVVSSDSLSNLLTTLVLWLILRAADEPQKAARWLLCGLAVGAALTVKSYATFLTWAVAMVLLYLVLVKQTTIKRAMVGYGAFLLGAALTGAWVYIRKWVVYGHPLMWNSILDVNWSSGAIRDFSMVPMLLSLARMFMSFVANFGWMNVRMTPPYYLVHLVLFGAAVWGLARSGRSRTPELPGQVGTPILLGILVSCNFLGVFIFNLYFNQPQGRYMFPTLAGIATLLALGWRRWSRALDDWLKPGWLAWGLVVFLCVFQVYGYIFLTMRYY